MNSFRSPLLTYCIGAIELETKSLLSLSVCWNDAFRKIYNYSKFESVKELIYFNGQLDFKHIYDLNRMNFLQTICIKCPYLSTLFACMESQFNILRQLHSVYSCNYQCSKLVRRTNIALHYEKMILNV
jgi:hypothetical protein